MSDPVLNVSPLGSRWQTADPFLFCVHHIDHYPKGNVTPIRSARRRASAWATCSG
jgi:hypothetical protein